MLKDLSYPQLKERAIALGMKTGVHQMSKEALIEAIEKLESAKDSGQLVIKDQQDKEKEEKRPPEEKSIFEKIADGVDHILHPNPVVTIDPALPGADQTVEVVIHEAKSSSKESELAKHPKFDKFK